MCASKINKIYIDLTSLALGNLHHLQLIQKLTEVTYLRTTKDYANKTNYRVSEKDLVLIFPDIILQI